MNWFALGAMAWLTGCQTYMDLGGDMLGPAYSPENVFREAEHLVPEMRRVAVLPLTSAGSESDSEFGRESLGPILVSELAKTQRFELVAIPPDQLKRLTGRSYWTGDERLPLGFFDRLREASGCDGVLFCQLTQYRAYQPLVIGWHLRLLDATEPRILWSVDEVFDGRDPSVVRAARHYAAGDAVGQIAPASSASVLKSPRRFAEYTVSALLATLPER